MSVLPYSLNEENAQELFSSGLVKAPAQFCPKVIVVALVLYPDCATVDVLVFEPFR